MERRRIGHLGCLTVVITCVLAACAGKDSVDSSADDNGSDNERSVKEKQGKHAVKDAGSADDADSGVDDQVATNAPTIDAPPDEYDCTYAEVAKSKHGYWFCAAKTGRAAARSLCVDLGGDFLIVDDEEENAWILDHVMDDTYIGFTDAIEEGKWTWVDGSKATYTNWDEMEPAEADFAFLEKASGRWKSTTATARAFACEGAKLFDVAHDAPR